MKLRELYACIPSLPVKCLDLEIVFECECELEHIGGIRLVLDRFGKVVIELAHYVGSDDRNALWTDHSGIPANPPALIP